MMTNLLRRYPILLLGMCSLAGAYPEICEGKEFAFKRQFEDTPPAFEKFYIDNSQLLSTPDGMFIKHYDGQLEQIRAVKTDYSGTYVLRVHTQCPLCGGCFSGKSSAEGTCCPLYDREVFPGIWTIP